MMSLRDVELESYRMRLLDAGIPRGAAAVLVRPATSDGVLHIARENGRTMCGRRIPFFGWLRRTATLYDATCLGCARGLTSEMAPQHLCPHCNGVLSDPVIPRLEQP